MKRNLKKSYIDIHPSIIKNGYYDKEYHRQKNNLPYCEQEYNNEKQLIKEQIVDMMEKFKILSYEDKKIEVIAIIDRIDFIINNHNRKFAYCLLLDIFPNSIEFINVDYQLEMMQSIKKIINTYPELEQYVKYVETDTKNAIYVRHKSPLYRNGDFKPIRIYFKLDL